MSDAEKQARAQVESIAAMVVALECDYARLDELRDEKESFTLDRMETTESNRACAEYEWAQEFPDEASELAELESVAGDCTSEEEARSRIEEDPLSVEIRSGWANSRAEFEPEEFRIVLCTGGPHVEIVGDLDRGEPSCPRILYRDWGTSGELFDFDREAVLTYCRVFYFGE